MGQGRSSGQKEQLVKGSKWGSRDEHSSTHERRTAKSRCFASSCEEVPTENSVCGSSLGTFSFAQLPISADKKVGVGALSFEICRPHLVRTNEARSMRLGWSPSTRAGLLGTGAQCYLPPMRPSRAPRRRRPRTRRGAGFGRNTFVGPPPRASPSVWGRLRACTDHIWLGAPRPAWRPNPLIERGPCSAAGFLGRYLVTVGFIRGRLGSVGLARVFF